MKKIWIAFAFLTAGAFLPELSQANTDLYSFPDLKDFNPRTAEDKTPPEPFIAALSSRTETPLKILDEAHKKGIGRMELIRLILMARESEKPLPELIQAREKGTRFAKMAKDTGTDNRRIKSAAGRMLKEINTEIKNKAEAGAETEQKTKTAGVEDPKP